MNDPVIIFGLNPVARAAKAIFDSNEIITYGFLTDDANRIGKEVDEVAVLGNMEDDGFLKLIGKKCEAFVAVDENKVRRHLVEMLNKRQKVMPVNAIHQRAYISSSASIGHGNFINMDVRIGHNTEVGSHCLLHTGVVIEGECEVGDFVQAGAGAIINSEVKIEEGVFIGSGAVLVAGITIGKNARIGAGSIVITDVEDNQTVFGNPAQVVNS